VGVSVRKINPELWLLLFLVLIAALLNFLVASQQMALVFYFLPTLYSAYHLGRRHATLTAVASIVLVALLIFANPSMFAKKADLPFARWLDLAVWGGTLMIAGYSTGTLYERNQKAVREMADGYEGMLVILQNFLANQKFSNTHAYRISMCATEIAEASGLDSGTVEDVRTAALLFNMKELGIANDVLCKAAQISEKDLQRGKSRARQDSQRLTQFAGSLTRAIPIFLTERQLRQNGEKTIDASLEVQILALADEYESLISGERGTKMSPSQAGEELLKRAGNRYDSLILNGFGKAFGGHAAGAGA
jgi:hypothetical protein